MRSVCGRGGGKGQRPDIQEILRARIVELAQESGRAVAIEDDPRDGYTRRRRMVNQEADSTSLPGGRTRCAFGEKET